MNVIIADNCPGLISGMKLLLSDNHVSHSVKQTDSLDELLSHLIDGDAQLVVTSSKWVIDESGIDVFRKFIKTAKVFVMCLMEDDDDARLLYEAGIHGLLGRSAEVDEYDRCFKELLHGRRYISAELLPVIQDHTEPLLHETNPVDFNLSARELQVIRYVSEGLSDKEIADKLFLSKRTVDNYRARLLAKLGAKNTGHLIALAYENRIIRQEK